MRYVVPAGCNVSPAFYVTTEQDVEIDTELGVAVVKKGTVLTRIDPNGNLQAIDLCCGGYMPGVVKPKPLDPIQRYFEPIIQAIEEKYRYMI